MRCSLRETVKYCLADSFWKVGDLGHPKISQKLIALKILRKGGEGAGLPPNSAKFHRQFLFAPSTEKIHRTVFDQLPELLEFQTQDSSSRLIHQIASIRAPNPVPSQGVVQVPPQGVVQVPSQGVVQAEAERSPRVRHVRRASHNLECLARQGGEVASRTCRSKTGLTSGISSRRLGDAGLG